MDKSLFPVSRVVSLLAALTGLLALGGHAQAATLTWSGTGANAQWNTAGNWFTGSLATGDSVVFDNTSKNVSTILGQDYSIADLTIGGTFTSTVSIGGANTLTLTGTGSVINTNSAKANLSITANLVSGTSQTWVAGNGRTVTISGNVAGAAQTGATNTLILNAVTTMTLSGDITDGGNGGALALTKSGNGTLNVQSSNLAVTGNFLAQGGVTNFSNNASSSNFSTFSVRDATVNITSGRVGASNELRLGTGGSRAILNISSGARMTTSTSQAILGYVASTSSVLAQSGTMSVGGAGLRIGNSGTTFAAYTLSSGSLNVSSKIDVGGGAGANAIFSQTGGTAVTGTLNLLASGTASVAVVDISGGSFTTGVGAGIIVQSSTGTGLAVITVRGSGAVTAYGASGAAGARGLDLSQSSSMSTSILNLLTGGTLETKDIGKSGGASGRAVANFDGGILKTGTFSGATALIGGLDNAFVYGGGLTIDTTAQSGTISQALTAPAGYGVGVSGGSIAVSSGGGLGYIAAPVVTFSAPSGGGVQATGVATIDGNGTVTGITLTSPGSGYASNESVTLTFTTGNAFSGSAASSFSVSAGTLNASGGLTKTGNNTLTLSASNTYTGTTRINGGTLALASLGSFDSSATIIVGGSGSSGVVLDLTSKTGTFTFGAGQTVGGIGTITIGAGKTVSSAGIWAPGNSIGSNAVTGNLSLSGTSQFELGTPGSNAFSPGTSDFTAVSGTLTLGGNLTLLDNANAGGLGSYAAGSYRIFTAPALSGTFASVTAPAGATTTRVGMVYSAGTATGQGVFANVYNLAAAAGTQTVNLGNTRAGTASGAVTLTSTAPTNATYTETLSTGGFSNTSSGFTASGSASGIAGGGSDSGNLLVGTGTSLTAGAQTGTTTLALFSNAVNGSGLAQQSIASQTITITGTVYDWARASFSGTSIDFGVVHRGATVDSKNVAFTNPTVTNATFQDSLTVSASTGNPLVTGSGFSSLAAGSGTGSLAISIDTSSAGSLSGTVALTLSSIAKAGTGLSNGTAVTVGGGVITTTGGVFSGNGTWNVNRGGAWGSLASGTNWTSTGGVAAAPGTFDGYTNTDTAMFGSAVTGGTATIDLTGVAPSLKSITFDTGSASYLLSSGSITMFSDSGTAGLNVGAGSHEIASNLSLTSLTAVDTAASSFLTLSGTISGSGGFVKTGGGELHLKAANSFSGNTAINVGTLKIFNASTLGSGTVTLASGATLNLNNLSIGNTLINNGGTILNSGSYTGTQTVSGSATFAGTTSGSITLDSGASATITGNVTSAASLAVSASSTLTATQGSSFAAGSRISNAGQFIVSASSGTTAIASTISGTGSLAVSGGGLVRLTGSSSGFSGQTTVSGNGTTLSVNGVINSNKVTVNAGAALGGSGVITGTVGGDGLIGPGNSPGILTVSQVDPTSLTSFAFEFTKMGDPIWSSGTASQNDVLQLTNLTTPFVHSLQSTNFVNVYFEVSSLSNGDIFRGGFFSNSSSLDFAGQIGGPTYQYFVLNSGSGSVFYNGSYYDTLSTYLANHSGSGITGVTQSVVTVPTANFSGGTITNGQVTQFVIIPEPDTIIFAGIGIGMAGWSLWKRRRIASILRK